ncbi:hypothetical protein [Halobacillus sp. A5]|uniref:hypothetical protein n=1 Tax=Halobacillus sp. A5 TaxID=2880263 RepID=UPI0020A6B481|nr:hypothetical protein [Halobacillus sp. A5]MCP3026536.1 hypothetical protein [Halobacillus sp. A5]
MEIFYQMFVWPVVITILLVHLALLLLKKKRAVLIFSNILMGAGAAIVILGLFSFVTLGVYGVVVVLLGMIFHVHAKDRMNVEGKEGNRGNV